MKRINFINFIMKKLSGERLAVSGRSCAYEGTRHPRVKSRITLICLLLTLGFGQMWADDTFSINGGYVYFDNTTTNWSNYFQFIGRQKSWAGYIDMSQVSNTKLYVCDVSGLNGWNGFYGFAVVRNTTKKSNGNTENSNSTNYTAYQGNYTLNSGSYYIITPSSSSNNCSVTTSYKGTAASSLNNTITVGAKKSDNNGSSYSDAASGFVTLTASSKTFSNYNTCNTSTSLSSGTISCGYTATTTLTAPNTDPTGYKFDGWYNSSGTRQTTSKTLTIYPTGAATYYAYYRKMYTFSAGSTIVWDLCGNEKSWSSVYLWRDMEGSSATNDAMTQCGTTTQYRKTYASAVSNIKVWMFRAQNDNNWPNYKQTTDLYRDVSGVTLYEFDNTYTGTKLNWQVTTGAKKATSGTKVYFDNTNAGWSEIWLKYGTSRFNRHTGAAATKVTGTDNLYVITMPEAYYVNWYFASSYGWTDRNNISDTHVGKRIPIQSSDLTSDITFVPSGSTSGSSPTQYAATSFSGHTRRLTFGSHTNGNITVRYTDESGTEQTVSSSSASYVDVAQTCKVIITAVPNSGYAPSGLTLGGGAITSGAQQIIRADGTIVATFVAEETHDVTVSYKIGSRTLHADQTFEVGVTTASNISSEEIDGFSFSSWSNLTNVTNNTGNTTTDPININTLVGGSDGSMTCNYVQWPCSLDINTVSGNTGYSSRVAMSYNATAKAYYKEFTTTAATQYFRFYINSKKYAPSSNTEVVITGTKVTAATDVTGYSSNMPSVYFNDGGIGSQIIVWFDYENKKAWVEEKTYNVTVAADSEGDVSPKGTVAVKQITGTTLTATPDADHAFSYWAISGGGITPSSSNTNPQTFKASTTGGSITAKFQNRWIMKGSGGVFGNWDTDKELPKTAANTYRTTLSLVAGTAYAFQVYDRHTGTWYGKTSTTITKTLGELTKAITLATGSGSTYNMHFTPVLSGDYTFTYNSSTGTLTIGWPDITKLEIISGSGVSAGYYNFSGPVGTVYSKSFTFSKNQRYSAKIVYHSDFYTFDNTSDMTIDNHTDWRLYNNVSDKICNVYAPVAGTYTYQFNSNNSGNTTLTVVFPTAYTITFGAGDINGSNSTISVTASPTFSSGDYVLASTAVTFNKGTTKDGYEWNGWYSNSDGTGTCHSSTDANWSSAASTRTGNISVYACYNYSTYTVTMTTSDRTGYGSGAPANQTGTYTQAMPTITPPTAANGYCFMGYWDGEEGTGTKYYNANGTSAHVWDKTSGATLYAYFKKAEITAITLNASMFEPVAAGDAGYVVANPTIAPTPEGTVAVCWELLYDNDNPVAGRDAETYTEGGTKLNQVRFSIAGLAAGGYKIKATLRLTNCSGTILDTYEVPFTIASDFTITVLYKCGDVQIKASTTAGGKPLDWTSITAPDDIFGYTFSKWKAGEGIEIDGADGNGEKASATIQYKASFNGTLTAIYTKKSIFYFKNTLGWSNVYVNFMSNQYWDGYKGSGNQNNYYSRNNEMSLVPGTIDIYYYEYTGSTSYYITFTSKSQDNAKNFWGKNPNVQVVVPTRPNDDGSPQTDFGYHAGTNMFIPLDVKVQTKNTGDDGGADYYNRGYWVVYDPITGKTGYTLEVYNKTDDSSRDTVKVMPFTFNAEGVLEATVDLEAATNYGIKFRRDNGMRYTKNGGTLTNDAEQKFEYHPDNWAACAIKTTAAGDYVFTINCSSSDGYLYLKAHFPAAVNDFQVYYKDNSVIAHPSRVITARASGVDTISFFVDKDKAPMLKARKVNSINGSTGAITWGALNINGAASQSLSVDSAAVYNFVVTQSTAGTIASIKNIGAYKGNYYIRCAALNSKWDFYRSDRDHLMTYSSFSESEANAFGEKFSHYKTKWCKYGKNVKFCIANDYSPCISDTLIQDVGNPYNNIDANGFLLDDGESEETVNRYSANIRFMWNRKTNKISRAYVASSTNPARLFLVLRGNYRINGDDDLALEEETSGVPSTILMDKENWMYEKVVKIKPGTRFKLYACYAQVTASPNGAQYFRGSYNSNAFSGDPGVDSENSVVLIGGSGEYQMARIIYDFKTNRLMAAWIPSGTDISSDMAINADVLVEREHHEPAQYITFANESSQLSGVKTVYGAMKFNRWILNNRANSADEDKDHASTSEQIAAHHPPLSVGQQKSIYERSLYFISFPFDVKASEIFGFGHYWDEWYLEYYDGLNRAKNGYWIDSDPNWKYVTPSMLNDFVLKANEGYILGLDLDYMQADNFTFWAHGISTVELFFPSTANVGTLKQTEITIPALSAIDGDPYRCTINRGTPEGDRRVKDSYWRCLGVPSLNIYNTALQDGSGNTISWTADPSALPFIYMWNKADNTLTAQTTSAFTFLPMHAYLVQNGGAIVWSNVSAKPSSIVARRENEQPAKEYNWCLKLEQDSQMIDQTFIRMSNLEQVTDSFDFGQDMIKEFNKKKSNIYTYIGYEQVAANSLTLHTEQTTVVPVGATIAAAGDYTFAMPEGTNGVGITLVDSETGVRTNLSAGMIYTLTLAKGDYTNRFFLEISPVSNSATDIELINGENGDASLNGVRKVIIDQQMYIIKGDKIYDARGAMIK